MSDISKDPVLKAAFIRKAEELLGPTWPDVILSEYIFGNPSDAAYQQLFPVLVAFYNAAREQGIDTIEMVPEGSNN